MLYQRTLKSRVTGQGIGLHSGRQVAYALLPAPPGSGIVFVRTDLDPRVEIPARASNVVETRLATTLGKDGATIGTVEHLLAALYGLGVDNARVEVDGPEVPIMDGSSAPFVAAIFSAGGTVAQRRPKRFLVIKKPVEVVDPKAERSASFEPASCFKVACHVDFKHPLITDQRYEVTFSERAFIREVCRARTFGFAKDVEAMRNAGLALGGSLENAIVIDDFSVQNAGGLRFPDEFVRHKLLDAIGDLALLGAPVIGRYVGHKAGHFLNHLLIGRLLETPRAYEIVEFRQRHEAEGREIELPSFGLGKLAPV